MKKILPYIFSGLMTSALLAANPPALALSGSQFQPGHIIDDSVFYNSGTMTVQTIQNFLNAKVPTCDTAGNLPYYGTYKGVTYNGNVLRKNLDPAYPPPYTCLRDYAENTSTHQSNAHGTSWAPSTAGPGNLPDGGGCDLNPASGTFGQGVCSAAQIIWTSAVAYGINPQVLLATMEKESVGPLILDDWPWPNQYKVPMGLGCPDGAPCDSQYFGFYNQMRGAAHQFKLYTNNPSGYNYTIGQEYILYHPAPSSCGSELVNITNQATANLYDYTPYVPNQAALNNLYGLGDGCSSYGNRNFWRIFNDWFGSTAGDPSGSFDLTQQYPSAVRVAGWALDPSVQGAINVHVYIDGAFSGAVPANNNRPDVGAHGFDGTVPWTKGGNHQVCLWAVGDAVGNPNQGLGCHTVHINNDPLGSLDAVRQAPKAVSVGGWGFDPSTNSPAAVHVYIDGVFAGAIPADDPRPDIGNIFPVAGPNHGFQGTVPWTAGGNHNVCAWVVGDSLGLPNAGLGCRTVNINNDPTGSLDLVTPATGGIRLAGWAFDHSLAGPVAIHVYVDRVFAGAIPAGRNRPDINNLYPGYGSIAGFDDTISATPGAHNVCAWVVGDNLGAPNMGLGCSNIH